MLDSIFDNLFTLIPIAIFIALRIAAAWKKKQASPAKANEPVSPAERKSSLPHWEVEKQTQRPITRRASPADIPPKPALAEKLPEFTTSLGARRVSSETPAGGQSRPPKAPLRQDTFPQSLNRLPAMKQALVLSEILGPPKALRE